MAQITEGRLPPIGVAAGPVLIRCSLELIKLCKTCRRPPYDYHDWIPDTTHPLVFPERRIRFVAGNYHHPAITEGIPRLDSFLKETRDSQ
jgi:hypothetical protein